MNKLPTPIGAKVVPAGPIRFSVTPILPRTWPKLLPPVEHAVVTTDRRLKFVSFTVVRNFPAKVRYSDSLE